MFLLGGPAFTGKTLLAHLLNQGSVTCLDEPDFHDPKQQHRGIPFLRELFPDRDFPPPPEGALGYTASVDFVERCEAAIHPRNLGMKTAGIQFIEYARVYRARKYPVIGVIRDIRDVVAEGPLPPWISGEAELGRDFMRVWRHRHLCDLVIRYEELVTNPSDTLDDISALIGTDLAHVSTWNADTVHNTMFKLDRHEMLRTGTISSDHIGAWRRSKLTLDDATHSTAHAMGYGT